MLTRNGFVINQGTLGCNFKKQIGIVSRFYETFNKKDAVKLAKFFAGRFLAVLKNTVHTHDSLRCPADMFYYWWTENKTIIRSMLKKTLKETDQERSLQLAEVSLSPEEDLDFFQKLFEETSKEDLELDELISKNVKNWEIDRIAMVDKIILKMAIAELKNFPSIPVKVTINEYIEISKLYSTPKSKQFINGVLDVLAKDLQKQGIVKKSGRGLIDNK